MQVTTFQSNLVLIFPLKNNKQDSNFDEVTN